LIKKFAALAVVAALVLVAAVVVRTLLFESSAPLAPVAPIGQIDRVAAVEHLAGALRFPTVSTASAVSPSGHAFSELTRFLETSFPLIHQNLMREQAGTYSLLYTWQGSDSALPGILFIAHMDVVPVDPKSESLWTHAAFSGDIADGFIWGRGAIDMKSSVLGLLEAVEYLLRQGEQPKRTIFLALSEDEEVGGKNGSASLAALLKSRGVRLEFTLDEGSYIVDGALLGLGRPAALIGVAEKGYLTLRLSARAPGGHSSMPSRGDAITRIARAVQRLQDDQMPASLGGAVSPMLDALAPEMPFLQRAIVSNRWLFAPLLLKIMEGAPPTNALIRTTIAPTMIEGGIGENLLPSDATVTVNVRIRPGDTSDDVIAHVRAAIDDPEIDIERVGESNEPLPISSIDARGYAILQSAAAAIYPDTVIAPTLVIGGTDTLHYSALAENSYRFTPLRLGASDLKRVHGINERIAADDYVHMVRFYAQVMQFGTSDNFSHSDTNRDASHTLTLPGDRDVDGIERVEKGAIP
jgi:carboxypeptidase PM20D1